MDLSVLIGNINWLAVFVLTIASFGIGMTWHQNFLFGKAWKEENYPNNKPIKVNVPLVFGGTALVHFLAIAGLSEICSGTGGLQGFLMGFFVSVVWVFPAFAGTYLFAGKSLKILAIDAGMYVVLFSLSGFILGIW